MSDTIAKWYADLLGELVLHGRAERVFPVIGNVIFISAGSLGDYIVYFQDGTHWSSTEYAKRVMESS